MSILEAIKSSIISIWSNKIRSFLTMLGMIIGVSSVITLVSIGKGVYNDVASLVQGMGTNLVFIVSGDISGLGNSTGGTTMTNPANFIKGDILKPADIDALDKMEEIEYISPMNIVSGFLQNGDKKAYPMIIGVNQNALHTLQNIVIDKGRMFANDEDKVLVISKNQVSALFGDENANPIGKKIKLGKDEFEIVGTIKQAKQTTNIFSSDFDNMTIMPFNEANKINGSEQIMRILIKVKDNYDAKNVSEEIKANMATRHSTDEFSVLTQEDMLDMMSSILNIMTIMITAIASISLLVGGVGIMNIMLVSVAERTKEIGIRKAIGATDGEILKQFLIEGLIITFLGGGIGVLVAYVVGIVFKAKTDIAAVVDIQTIALASGISIFIGLVFGLFPAFRAAKKNPVDALRYE